MLSMMNKEMKRGISQKISDNRASDRSMPLKRDKSCLDKIEKSSSALLNVSNGINISVFDD